MRPLAAQRLFACATLLAGLAAALAVVSIAQAGPRARSLTAPALYVAPKGSDAARCSKTAPCATFDRAYQLAKLGDTVEVAGGTYPSQTIGSDPKPGKVGTCSVYAGVYSSCITFRPAAGARVSMPGLLITKASFIRIQRMTLTGTYDGGLAIQGTLAGGGCVATSPHDVVAQGLDAHLFFIGSGQHLGLLGGTYHDFTDASQVKACGTGVDFPSSYGAIDGVTIRDYRQKAPGVHMECLHFQQGTHWVIRNSRFLNCAQNDLSIQTYESLGISDLLVENSIFDLPNSHPEPGDFNAPINSMPVICNDADSPMSNVTIRFNSVFGGISLQWAPGCPSPSNVHIYGNISDAPSNFSCTSESYAGSATWESNVFFEGAPGRCGQSNASVTAWPFADPSKYDFHLPRGSVPLGRAKAVKYPPRDIEGDLRPVRVAPDAGADQRETALLVPGKSIGAVRIGEGVKDVEAFYGPPRRFTRWRPRTKTKPPPALKPMIASYRTHGGTLWVIYQDEKVVGLGTTSPYYTTEKGLGVGSAAKDLPTSDWIVCRHAYRTFRRGVATFFGPSGGRKKAQIVSVSMLRQAYEAC